MIDVLVDGPVSASARIILAHGAGAGMDSAFMTEFAQGLAARRVRVVRFEFPYMARRRNGLRSPPDRAPRLLDHYRAVVAQLGEPGRWFIGGKSMGGRMASMLADELGVAGLVCVGYPFHPPHQPERTRTEHLAQLRTRCLIVQGTRDAFGTPADVNGYSLSKRIRIVWIPDADHSLLPLRSSGLRASDALTNALDAVVAFMRAARKRTARHTVGVRRRSVR